MSKIAFLVSLLFGALVGPFDPYSPFKFLFFIILVHLQSIIFHHLPTLFLVIDLLGICDRFISRDISLVCDCVRDKTLAEGAVFIDDVDCVRDGKVSINGVDCVRDKTSAEGAVIIDDVDCVRDKAFEEATVFIDDTDCARDKSLAEGAVFTDDFDCARGKALVEGAVSIDDVDSVRDKTLAEGTVIIGDVVTGCKGS